MSQDNINSEEKDIIISDTALTDDFLVADRNSIPASEGKQTPDSDKPLWYVIHTYSGYENKVKADIEKIVEKHKMKNVITELVIPIEEVMSKTPTGKDKIIQHKKFPTYVFVKMIMNDDAWFVIRNTRGVTSFVGPGSKPVPLTEDEVAAMGIETYEQMCRFAVGDVVVVKNGPFENAVGSIIKINAKKHEATILVDFGNQQTELTLNFEQIKQME
jgi:transcriptional antiterminator NusG